MYKHLLFPIDGTSLAAVTIDHAVAYAKAAGARLTFLHGRPDIAASNDGALLHAMAPPPFAEAAASFEALAARVLDIAGRALDTKEPI